MALATANWSPLGEDVFYRKFELYSFSWDIPNFEKCMIRAAPYGGPIAVMPPPVVIPGQPTGKPNILLFTASGQPISSIRWSSGIILEIGWSLTEELLVVQEDGKILFHDIFGKYLKHITLGQEVQETQAVDCRIFSSFYGTGVAVMTTTHRVFVISNVDDPRIRRLATIRGISRAPSSWCMVSENRQVNALVAVDTDIHLLQQSGDSSVVTPQLESEYGEFTMMSMSFNHQQIALFTDTSYVCLCSANLSRVICEFNTKKPTPDQMAWCGVGAILLHWPGLVLIVGADKYYIKYSYTSPVYLQPELDGVRIISDRAQDFFQKVPAPVQDVFKIGSMQPGALLLEAWREFSSQSQQAQEYLQHLNADLAEGIQMCIEAAAHEFDIDVQKKLLKAASFGRTFVDNDNPDLFVTTCRRLRVLNNIREYTVGMPLSYNQLEAMSEAVLIDRLVSRHLFPLAMKICSYLRIPDAEGSSRIVKHWALMKVKDERGDEVEVARKILDKLSMCSGLNIAEIADHAISEGKTQLAIQLLEAEPRASEQVPLLLKLDKEALALRKAIESGNTDLIYRVILQHLKKKLSLGEFYMAIRKEPQAQALYLQYCRANGETLVQQGLFYQEGAHQEEALCRLHSAYSATELAERNRGLAEAQAKFADARNDFAAKCVDEQIRLLRAQQQLEDKLGGESFVDLSMHQTLHQLLTANHLKLADGLRRDFRVSDRRWWWLRINTMAEKGEWTELEKFSKSKKSPIGYEPFVEICAKFGNKYEANKYVAKVSPENRVKCLVKSGEIEAAAELAQQRGEPVEIGYVLSKVSASSQYKYLTEPLLAAARAAQ